MRGLIELAVRRPVTVTMFALAVVAFGIVGYQRLSVELFPDISYPTLTVRTEFADAAPQEVETMVTRPVEEAVGVIGGLERLHSVSRPGVSEVSMELSWGSDMSSVAMDVREKLDRIVFPVGTEPPLVLRYDPSLDPIMRLALYGPDDLRAVRRLAERRLKPDLETVLGVAAAQLRGGLEEEIRIEIDQERLAALGISLATVRDAVGAANINVPGGALRGEDWELLIRTVNELDSVDEIANLIVLEGSGGRIVRLSDVAKVELGAREREEITRFGGKEVVEIAVFKEGDANTVLTARALAERIQGWQKKLPEGYELTVLFDQSRYIESAIREVRDSTLIGGLLAILVLLLFLRDLKSTVIIATAIPLSIVATFMAMYRLDVSLNIMSLGGLTLGVGMLVDNAIVVLEAIHRRRHEGAGPVQAALEGATEVGPAVVASTLTTIAVFLPIVFVEGVAGQLFKDQAITVTISLLASLLVAVTVIPMLSGRGARGARSVEALAPDSARASLGWASRAYDRLLRGAVRRAWLTIFVAAGLFAIALAGVRSLETELIPRLRSGELFYELQMPEGTSLAATDRIAKRMESLAAKEKGIARYFVTVGSRQASGGVSVNTKAENLAQLDLVLADRTEPDVEEQISSRLRDEYRAIPDARIRLGYPTYFSLQTPIEVAVFGEDLGELRRRSLVLAERLSRLPGFVDVRSSLEAGNPELQVAFDRRRVAALGLDVAALSNTLRDRVQGVVPTRFKETDRQIDIRILNQESMRRSIEDVRRLILPGPDGSPIRLLSVADVRTARGPAEIHRLQQQRAALITANLDGRSLGDAVDAVQGVLDDVIGGRGLTAEIGGQNREMQVSFASLKFAVGLAIFLVYLVMASIFESLVHPLIVLSTIPLALIGVVAVLLATHTTVTVIVLIGVILLVGIVVNNAIVLIDGINRYRRDGMDKLEAVIRAGHVRLRPILMTTSTTVLALVPTAIGWGEGGELRAPLAITVTAGLITSTLLTLVVIPAAYMLVPSRVAPDELEPSP